MRKLAIVLFGLFISFYSFAQTTISGKITDAITGESLIGATIIFGKGKGTSTDFDGNYSLSIQSGERNLKISYVGYKEISKTITVGEKPQIFNFKLNTILLNEVQVVASTIFGFVIRALLIK